MVDRRIWRWSVKCMARVGYEGSSASDDFVFDRSHDMLGHDMGELLHVWDKRLRNRRR